VQKKRISSFLGIIVLIIIFFFIAKSLHENWQKVPFERLKFNHWYLILSFCIWFGGFPFSGFVWKVNLQCIGEKITFIQSLRIMGLSFLPRYLPGKIWGIAGQAWITKKEGGIPGEKGGIAAVLGTTVNMLSGLLLFLIIFPFALKEKLPGNFYLLFTLIPLFIIIHPSIFIRIVNYGLKKLKRKTIEVIPKYSQILKLLFLYALLWIIQCIGMFFVIRSFYLINLSFFIFLCGIYPAAWTIGFLSFITPGGLGVREGALAYFLSFYMPTSIGIIASFVIRIWATIGEVTLALILAKNIKKYI
jgi:hypothetical protein